MSRKSSFLLILVMFCLLKNAVICDATMINSSVNPKEDSLSMPLIDNAGVPLVAMLDTATINNKIKTYINILMTKTLQTSIRAEIQDAVKEAMKDNSTIDIIRNITLQQIKEAGKEDIKAEAKDCTEIQERFQSTSGVYTIYPEKYEGVKVYCDMTTDNGGWTIIQRRYNGSVNFQRTWTDYENGFGDIKGEYWLGNKYIHQLTSNEAYEIRIDLTDRNNNKKYAVYKTFVVGDAASKYRLTVGNYSGNAGDGMRYNSGMAFSSDEQDNDIHRTLKCGRTYGPWWHKKCGHSGLNDKFKSGLFWYRIGYGRAKTSIMMLRKI